jgi:hypothetical protein
MDPGRVVVIIIALILIGVCVSYVWRFLFSPTGIDDLIIYQSSSGGIPALLAAGARAQEFSGASIVPFIYPGGEYSISTWIYVTKWTTIGNKPFLILSNGGNRATDGFMSLVMYLGKNENKLGIRMSYGDITLPWSLVSPNGQLTLANDLYADSSMGPDSSTQFSLDINTVDIQRWVNITAVISGRTADIYMDGKLARSSVLPHAFKVDPGENPTITLGHPSGFNGIIGKTRAANIAYTPDKVYNYYQEGPFKGLTIGFQAFDILNYTVTIKNKADVLFTNEEAT